MRISTSQMYSQGLSMMLAKQAQVARHQAEIATGKKLLSPADGPAAAAQVLGISNTQAITGQYQKNADMAVSRLQLEETAIADASATVLRLRELAIQGRSEQLSDNDRRFIAMEVRELQQQLLTLANTQEGGGEYIFSGSKVRTQPFILNAAGGAVTYQGDQTVRELDVSPTRAVADGDPGDRVFMAIRNGNGTFATSANAANTGSGIVTIGSVTNAAAYVPDNFRIVFTSATTFDVIDDTTATTVLAGQPYTANAAISFNGLSLSISGAPAAGDTFHVNPSANQSVFTTVDNLAEALETPITSDAVRAQVGGRIDRALVDLDQTLENFLEVRATIGARMRTIESQKTSNDDYDTQLTQLRSNLEDVDIVEAASNLNLSLSILQASQAAFARMQGLSLFNFLR